MDCNLIPVEVVKSITGTTDDAVATQQGATIIGMLQAYLGLVLKKQDFTGEKVTIPYHFSRVIKPKYAPINSVSQVGIITHNGTYKADETSYFAIGRFTVELLPHFWSCFHYSILPSAVASVEISYNAGLYTAWSEVPAVIQEAAQELLKYKYDSEYAAGYQSEHLGDYSYTKGTFAKNSGIPAEIAGMLDGLEL